MQLLKTKKPTGNPYRPPEFERAHRVEALIDERVGARELSDSDADDDANSSDASIEVLDGPSTVHTAIARRAATPPPRARRQPRLNAPALVDQLSQVLDPKAQQLRDDERANRSFQSTHFLTVSQQLRDAQATIESLRTQISVMQNHTHDVERARDRAELKLEMHAGGLGARAKPRPFLNADRSDVIRVGGKIRCERIYPDGGACTYWISDTGSASASARSFELPSHLAELPPSPLDLSLSSSSGSWSSQPSHDDEPIRMRADDAGREKAGAQ